jgi:hypothetical protein
MPLLYYRQLKWKCQAVSSAVTVSPRAVSIGFGSALVQIPRFRFGSVFGTSLECTAFSALKNSIRVVYHIGVWANGLLLLTTVYKQVMYILY